MARRKTRATVAQWDWLRKAGKGLATTDAPTVTLWPNGEREIWVKSADGTLGFRVVVSEGPAGLGLHMYCFGGPNDKAGDVVVQQYGRYCDYTQYRQDARSQAFKRWTAHEETEADVQILGESYRRDKLASAASL